MAHDAFCIAQSGLFKRKSFPGISMSVYGESNLEGDLFLAALLEISDFFSSFYFLLVNKLIETHKQWDILICMFPCGWFSDSCSSQVAL